MISTLLTNQLRNTYGVDIRVDHVIVRNGSKRISELYPTASSNAVFAEVIYAIK